MEKFNIEKLTKMSYEDGKKALEDWGYIQNDQAVEDNCPNTDYVEDEYYTLYDIDGEEADIISYERFYADEKCVKEGWVRV